MSPPKRPDVGTQGRKVSLRTNFYEIQDFPRGNVFHYDVSFEPEIPPKICGEMFQHLMDQHGDSGFGGLHVVFDGRCNLYSPKELSFVGETFTVKEGPSERAREFTVTVKKAAEVNMESLRAFIDGKGGEIPMDAIQALDVIMGQNPTLTMSAVGRGYFSDVRPFLISEGAEVWLGYQQSVRPTKGKLLLNIDLCAAAFLQPLPVIEVVETVLRRKVEEVLRRGALENRSIRELEKALKSRRVEVTHAKSKRTYRINGLGNKNAIQHTFETETGATISVDEYFRDRYNTKLQYPELPLLHVGPKNKNLYLPMEVCRVAKGQRISKLSPKQTADMIKITAQKPHIRIKHIEDGVRQLIKPDDPFCKDFGVSVSKKSTEVQGRILNPPRVQYSKQSRSAVVTPSEGAWQMRGSTFFKGTRISSWGVLVVDDKKFTSARDVGDFLMVLQKMGRETGVDIQNVRPSLMYANPRRVDDIEPAVQDLVHKVRDDTGSAPQLLLVILPKQSSALYGEVKRVCDTMADVVSQCALSKNIKKKQGQYCGNLLLKINVKLGGVNSVIESTPSMKFFLSKPAIIFGADVTHPAPGSSLPSIAALVGSMDAHTYRYATTTRAQLSRQEIIEDLQNMVRELLISFYQATKQKPMKIMFYRDGVSEGQFAAVLQHEIKAIKQACSELEANYDPTVTFVVAQKRHHARFFADKRDADRSGNTLAGTVVDTGVTHPTEFDFYLTAHAGIQGTSRPCHYHVLYDENQFTADHLQNFTNQQCYNYARCTRSVSLVPAAYYAHLSAFRARFHARGDLYGDEESVMSGNTGKSQGSIEFAGVGPRTKSVMYFV